MSYRLTRRAQGDLEDILDYISERNPSAAVRMLGRFTGQWTLLASQPNSGQPCDHIAPGLRRLVTGSYVAFYRTEGERREVLIVRVMHGKRDITSDDFAA